MLCIVACGRTVERNVVRKFEQTQRLQREVDITAAAAKATGYVFSVTVVDQQGNTTIATIFADSEDMSTNLYALVKPELTVFLNNFEVSATNSPGAITAIYQGCIFDCVRDSSFVEMTAVVMCS